MRIRAMAARLAPLGALLAAACSGTGDTPRFALQARLGVYGDGSGRAGLAALVTLRDASGAGPDVPWDVTVRDGSGATVASIEYPASGSGSSSATWFPAVAPSAGRYEILAARGSDALSATVSIAGGSGLALPEPVLAPDASRIDWEPVPGAQRYLCRVFSGGALVLETGATTTGCDLAGLPPGAYSASILALSADLASIAASPSQRPELGAGFDVSEGRIGFARSDGSAPATLVRAAGGAYDDGVGERSLAMWISITDPSGVATSVTWDVRVVGPNLPPSDPLLLTYWPRFPRLMAWAPGTPASPGIYTVTAQSTLGAATSQFTVGAPAWLDPPFGVTASDGAQGSASASWQPVAGASAYLASAFDGMTGERVASQWVAGTSASFPAGTFTAGRSYDVFVAATDADMVNGAVPTQVSIAENVFDYASFTAR